MLSKIRPYMMPIMMILGGIFYSFFSRFSFLAPYLIFTMLLLTYSNLSLKKIRFSRFHLWLILIQVVGCVVVYFALKPFSEIVAQGAMICVLAPTATTAPVIVRMLKGDVESVITYSLLCNTAVAFVASIVFSFIGNYGEVPFFDSFLLIGKRVALLLILPLILAVIIQKLFPVIKTKSKVFSDISFYLWCVALVVVTAKIVHFIVAQGSGSYGTELMIALCSMIICVTQFLTGRKIGSKYDNTIAGGQGLGQKNTILAIWMAQTYLNPISSIGPGTYVLWQNMVNSYQIWQQRKNLE